MSQSIPMGRRRGRSSAGQESSPSLPGSRPSSGTSGNTLRRPSATSKRRSSFNNQNRSPYAEEDESDSAVAVAPDGEVPAPKHGAKGKRGLSKEIYQCEICHKWYRHSACLIKHRWQHTDYWQHASALQMTKHQTVMLLETAAILTSGSSLPDEKSFWPAAVSPPSSGLLGCETLNTTTLSRSSQYGSFSAASSIPTIPSKLNSQSGSTDSENATDEADELDEEDSGAREEDMFVMEEMDAGAGMDLDEEQAMPPPSVVVKGRTANGPAAVPAQSLFKLQRSSVPLLPPTHYSQSAPTLGFFASRPSQDAIIIESQPLTHASGFDTEMAC